MASRFFGGGDDSNSSESDSSDDSSDQEQQQQYQNQKDSNALSKFEFDSSSEDDEKRVVRSEKDKRFDQLQTTIRALRNSVKINDWVKIQTLLLTLNKQLNAARNVIKKEGIPKFYFKAMIELEVANKESKARMKLAKKQKTGKTMNATNVRALNTMAQKLRKQRAAMTTEYTKYEADPLVSDEEEEEKDSDDDDEDDDDSDSSSSAESESDSDDADAGAAAKKHRKSDDDDDDDDDGNSSDSSDSSDSSSSGSDIDLSGGITRDFWVKKKDTDDEEDDADEERAKRRARRKERGAKKAKGKLKEKEDKKAAAEAMKTTIVFTPEIVVKKLRELIAKFGRRTTDRTQLVNDLRLLMEKATDPAAILKVRVTLVSALFDQRDPGADYMNVENWRSCYKCLTDTIDFLRSSPGVRLSEDDTQVDEAFDDVGDDDYSVKLALQGESGDLKVNELLPKAAAITDDDNKKADGDNDDDDGGAGDRVQYVAGNLYSFVRRLSDEFNKSLQNIDFHNDAYIDRLREEADLVKLVCKARDYYEEIGKVGLRARLSLLHLELVHYRYNPSMDALPLDTPAPATATTQYADDNVEKICSFLYRNGDARQRARALLCQVYYLALHNHFHRARDLLLMSHAQDTVNAADISTRILFNRALAQLGLCAFRVGELRQAMNSLMELFATNRVKELLAQGTTNQRWHERDLDKERIERLRQYPFHRHMNMDMLEAVHMCSAMFVEVPNMAVSLRGRSKVVNKHFRRLYEHHTRQAFNGPPENTRETVLAATRAVQTGDWKACCDHIFKLRMWDMMSCAANVKAMLTEKVKKLALKTYMLAYAEQYVTVSLSSLVEMFKLPTNDVHKILSTMIVNDQLRAAWDEPNHCLVTLAAQPTRLQKAALRYADKVALLVEQNERLLDNRSSGGDQRKTWVDYGSRQQWNRGGGGGGSNKKDKSKQLGMRRSGH